MKKLILPKKPQKVDFKHGGEERNRTAVDGFAGRCITTLPPRQKEVFINSNSDDGIVAQTENNNQ